MNLRPLRPFVRNMLIKQVAGKARKDHYPAPYAMIDLWAKHGASVRTGYEAEAKSFGEIMMYRHVAQPDARLFPAEQAQEDRATRPIKGIKHVHVVGAGVMGGDIAAWCALRGHT